MLGHRDGCHRKPLKTIERGHTPLIFQSRSVSAVTIGVVSKRAVFVVLRIWRSGVVHVDKT
jgi:hypothetical protein